MFAQSLESWPETSVTTSTGSSHNMFHGATAFHSRFSCPSGNHGPPVKCTCKPGSCLDDTNFKDAVEACLSESAEDGRCVSYGTVTTGFGIMEDWDTSLVTDMSFTFGANRSYSADFNADISRWDTSGVKTMRGMFNAATTFNQEIGSWNVSQVTDMSSMFEDAENFNMTISDWDTSMVTSMERMFAGSISFSQPVLLWNTSNLENTTNMFLEATAFMSLHACSEDGPPESCACAECLTDFTFNSSLASCLAEDPEYGLCENFGASSGFGVMPDWNVRHVADMRGAFKDRSTFNGDITLWDTRSVTTMESMFQNAIAFAREISDWEGFAANTPQSGIFLELFNSTQILNVKTRRF